MLYRVGTMMEFEGRMLDYITVNSREEEKAARGWFDHPHKAIQRDVLKAKIVAPFVFFKKHWQFWLMFVVAIAGVWATLHSGK